MTEAHRCRHEIVLRTVPVAVDRTVKVDDEGLRIDQTLRNLSRVPVQLAWTEHPSWGGDLLGPDTSLEIGGRPETRAQAVPGTRGFQEVDGSAGSYLIRRPSSDLAVEVNWDPKLFPALWIWQEHRASHGFPWWGLVDAMAVEPASAGYRPDPGRLGPLELAPGAELTGSLRVRIRTTH
jgi:hypothetical protein